MFPENLVQACFQGIQTEYEFKPIPIPTPAPAINGTLATVTVSALTTVADILVNASNVTEAAPLMKMKRVLVYRDGMNVLGKKNLQNNSEGNTEVCFYLSYCMLDHLSVQLYEIENACIRLQCDNCTPSLRPIFVCHHAPWRRPRFRKL